MGSIRSRPNVVKEWGDVKVARRWLMLCPERRDKKRQTMEPTEFEINRIVNNKEKLSAVRSRLSDISWWMRLLSQNKGVALDSVGLPAEWQRTRSRCSLASTV